MNSEQMLDFMRMKLWTDVYVESFKKKSSSDLCKYDADCAAFSFKEKFRK
jgi:hypothetical protein